MSEPPVTGAPDADRPDADNLDLARRMLAATRGMPAPRPSEAKAAPRRPKRKTPRDNNRDPMLLGQAMEALIHEQGWDTEVSVHLILTKWSALVGDVNAAHTVPESFVDGVLTVRAESSTWASSMRLLAPQLLAKLNESLGQGTVTRIVALGPQAPSWKKGLRSVAGRGPRDTYG